MTTKHFAPQRYLIAGIITVIPLWLTWIVFELVLKQLSSIGRPWVKAMTRLVEQYWPAASQWELGWWVESTMAVIVTLAGLYILGWAVTRMVGRRLLEFFEAILARIPFVTTVYSSVKKMLAAIQQKPEKLERVVLIPFPTPEMKTVGFVTGVLTDSTTGQSLATVYVPTTPNPTSGYLEIVPLDQVVSTDWTVDEAITFVISGGAVAPADIHFNRP